MSNMNPLSYICTICTPHFADVQVGVRLGVTVRVRESHDSGLPMAMANLNSGRSLCPTRSPAIADHGLPGRQAPRQCRYVQVCAGMCRYYLTKNTKKSKCEIQYVQVCVCICRYYSSISKYVFVCVCIVQLLLGTDKTRTFKLVAQDCSPDWNLEHHGVPAIH